MNQKIDGRIVVLWNSISSIIVHVQRVCFCSAMILCRILWVLEAFSLWLSTERSHHTRRRLFSRVPTESNRNCMVVCMPLVEELSNFYPSTVLCGFTSITFFEFWDVIFSKKIPLKKNLYNDDWGHLQALDSNIRKSTSENKRSALVCSKLDLEHLRTNKSSGSFYSKVPEIKFEEEMPLRLWKELLVVMTITRYERTSFALFLIQKSKVQHHF